MASVQSPQLPTIDLDEYRWKQPESQPGLWQRRACGAEAIVGVESRNKRGENDLFVSATVQLKDGKHSLKGVQQAAQRAWLVLRCQQPQIACSVAHDGQIKCLIQYRAPKDNQEAQEWAERTIVAEASERSPLDVRDAHVKSLLTSGPKSADATTIDISASVTDLDSLVGDAEISFVFHSNHIYYDGIGLREMIGAFFRGLAIALGRDNLTSPAKIDWEKSAQNLNPAYAELLRSDQQISGPSFDDALKDQLGGMMRMMGRHGLQTRDQGDKDEHGLPKTMFHTFTQEQSQEIVSSVKGKLGNDHTITQLAAAAVLLALVKSNPPTGESASNIYLTSSSINGRRWMKEPYSSGEVPYFACTQAYGVVAFENLKDYVQPPGQEKVEKTRELLTKAARAAKAEYARCLNRPNQLAISIPTMEMFAARFFSQELTGEPGHKTTSPYFASDGITDRYIPHEYFSESKQKVFSIRDFHFWLNQYDSFPSIRLSSWRGCSRLSIDYNTAYYSQEDMQTYLDDVPRYMLTFVS